MSEVQEEEEEVEVEEDEDNNDDDDTFYSAFHQENDHKALYKH